MCKSEEGYENVTQNVGGCGKDGEQGAKPRGNKHGVSIHQKSAGTAIRKLGLQWTPINVACRTYAVYHTKLIRDYLVTLDKYVKLIKAGGSNKVFIFMDNSYTNIHHA